jgi:hypothetical protein
MPAHMKTRNSTVSLHRTDKPKLFREWNAHSGKRSPFECRNRLGVHEVVRRNDRNDFGPTVRELMTLSDNQVGDRLHAALEAVGTDEGETIRTALVAARQTLNLLEQGLLIAAERNSDDVRVVMNQPIVPPSKT